MLRLIILNYKRPENVKKIVFALWKVFPNITIINNNPDYQLPYWGGGLDVINNDRNYFCMERWIRCFEYPEEYKIILDDDILPSITLIKNMVKSNLPITGIYGKRGVNTANAYNELEDVWKPEEVDFIIGSCIFSSPLRCTINNIGNYHRYANRVLINHWLGRSTPLRLI